MEGQYFIFWNWAVVIYLFVAGLSAGALGISALAYLIDQEKYEKTARIGALIAPFPLQLGLLALIYDLERPALFWKLLTTWQGDSIMSIGAWLLLAFSFLSFLYFYLWLPERWDLANLPGALARRFPKSVIFSKMAASNLTVRFSRPRLLALRTWVAMAGIPLAILVGIYTGLLLGVLTPRPLWNNPVLPLLFLISALKTGTAAIGLSGWFLTSQQKLSRKEPEPDQVMLRSVDLVLVIFSLIALGLYVFGLYAAPRVAGDATALIMGGEFTLAFWGIAVFVGIFLPLAYALYELAESRALSPESRRSRPWLPGFISLCVLTGALYLRYVIVYAGQTAPPL